MMEGQEQDKQAEHQAECHSHRVGRAAATLTAYEARSGVAELDHGPEQEHRHEEQGKERQAKQNLACGLGRGDGDAANAAKVNSHRPRPIVDPSSGGTIGTERRPHHRHSSRYQALTMGASRRGTDGSAQSQVSRTTL
jgi:hypothetical protein